MACAGSGRFTDSRPATSDSKAATVGPPSRAYSVGPPATKDDAGTIGVLSGASGVRGGRPAVTATVDRSIRSMVGR
jgi:hypothetical protein